MEHFNPSLPARFPEKAICTNGKPSIGGAQPQQMLLESFPVATWLESSVRFGAEEIQRVG
jgi:hypothetical protein